MIYNVIYKKILKYNMLNDIIAVLEKHKKNDYYFKELAKIKLIIDKEYDYHNELVKNKNMNKKYKKFLKNENFDEKEINELKEIYIEKYTKNEDIADYFLSLDYYYYLCKNNKTYKINLCVYGDKECPEINFYYSENENDVAIINLFEDMQFRDTNIKTFVLCICHLLKNSYQYIDDLFEDVETTYIYHKEKTEKDEKNKKKIEKKNKNYNKEINKLLNQ